MTDNVQITIGGSSLGEDLVLISRLGEIHATSGVLALISDRDLSLSVLVHASKASGFVQASDAMDHQPSTFGGYRFLSANLSWNGVRFWVLSDDQLGLTVVFLPAECPALSWGNPDHCLTTSEILALLFV
ncbi:MAG: hypothetical protein KJ072_22420 [Verrucomicrobia bacterium]|nr:hypothetical protein [Verrucomicrobiota bacterium]